MAGGYEPTDIANEALVAIGSPTILGNIEDGSDEATVILIKYRQCLMQLLRAAHWDMARRTAPLQLLADASGNTPNVSTYVPQPYLYSYAYPSDCLKARFIPANWSNQATDIPSNNIQAPSTPLVTGLSSNNTLGVPMRPTRFLVATDPNYPPPQLPIPWDQPGISPQGRTVILSNVKFATLVYTQLMLYPSVWDSLFRAAFVAYLASEVAFAIWSRKGNPKLGMQVRDEQVRMVRDKVTEARLTSANEGYANADIAVDWMRARRVGGGPWTPNGWGFWGNWGDGVLGYGCDSLMVASGAAF